ncbi:MAG: hypothetical protein RLZZ58_1313, partial [Pseudomonadota bacterium]
MGRWAWAALALLALSAPALAQPVSADTDAQRIAMIARAKSAIVELTAVLPPFETPDFLSPYMSRKECAAQPGASWETDGKRCRIPAPSTRANERKEQGSG